MALPARAAEHAPAPRPASSRAPALSLVIPCYNERERLEPVVRAALGFLSPWPGGAELILVDDGSVDDTWTLIREIEVRAAGRVRGVRLAHNLGKGAAVRAGFAVARGAVWGYADADGAARWRGLTLLARALQDPGVDAAIGERNGPDVVTSPWRRLLGVGFRAATRALASAGVSDTQCGLKLFRARVIAPLLERMTIDGYAFDVELLHLLRSTGAGVRGVCVPWTHQPGSRVRPLRDGARMFVDLVARWLGEWWQQRRARAHLVLARSGNSRAAEGGTSARAHTLAVRGSIAARITLSWRTPLPPSPPLAAPAPRTSASHYNNSP